MQICYLIAFPDPASESKEPALRIKNLKDAPYFEAVDVDVRMLGQQSIMVEAVNITIIRQRLDERVQVVECRFELPDALSLNAIQHRQRIETELRRLFIAEPYLSNGLYEEYVVLMVKEALPSPDKFIEHNAANLARFIRSQREVLDQAEIEETLISRVRYSKDDLTLVDWEGAIVIAPAGDFQSDIELLKIGNYQLLRYRMLDQAIETSLRQIGADFRTKKRGALRPGPTRSSLRHIVDLRLEMMLDFEHTSQNLLLIGDWYTAKLYTAIQDELYLVTWKETVQEKLNNLEAITQTIQDNFSLTWRGLMEQAELAGWIFLLIGYFILFYLDWVAAH
jgi:hypothetical protein